MLHFDAAYRQACLDILHPTSNQAWVNHGGIAAVISTSLAFKVIASQFQPYTMESVCFTVTGLTVTVVVWLLYHPGSVVVSDLFFRELTEHLEALVLYEIVIAGDFNPLDAK